MPPHAHSVSTLPVSVADQAADRLRTADAWAATSGVDDPVAGEVMSSPSGRLPNAHLVLTERFAPFPGHEAYRLLGAAGMRPALKPSPAVACWHLQGRQGELTGLIFGDFEIGAISADGDAGPIYRARQRSRERRASVKTFAGGSAQDPGLRERFEREVRAAGLIRSPQVVEVFASGIYNGTAYVVMEAVDGTDLAEIIAEYREEDCRLPSDMVAGWILHAARGLAATAGAGLVHRDIKPANLLINLDNAIKIADFGNCKFAGEDDPPGLGTPSYLSPEQGRGVRCDQRADVYSLGVVFYELLTNRKPFVGTTRDSLVYQHNFTEPRLPRELAPEIPEACQAMVVRCLQKDPARRYQTARDLIADLERFKAGEPVIGMGGALPWTTGADEAVRRHLGHAGRWVVPGLVSLCILLVTALVTGVCWWWLQGTAAVRL